MAGSYLLRFSSVDSVGVSASQRCPLDTRTLQATLPFLKAVSPASLFVKISLAVANSSPMNPSRRSQVLIAYFGFSFCCGFGLAVLTSFAIWLSARQS